MRKFLLLASVILMMLTACSKDIVYYEYKELYNVRVNVDWTQANIHPNGASVYVYNADGTLYSRETPFSNPNSGVIMLPAGDYKMIVFSDTPEEYSDLLIFQGMDNWETATVRNTVDEVRSAKAKEQMAKDAAAKEQEAKDAAAKDVASSMTKGAKGINVGAKDIGEYVKTPDTLAAARIESFHVDGHDVEYYTDQPQGNNIDKSHYAASDVSCTASRVINEYRFKVHVKGLKYAKGETETDLVGVSRGYSFGTGINISEKATHTFILNNRKYDDESEKDGTITGSQLSFGILPDADSNYYLVLHFVLRDNTEYPITVDITDLIKRSSDFDVDLDVELPYAEDMSGSVNVGSWSDEHQQITL